MCRMGCRRSAGGARGLHLQAQLGALPRAAAAAQLHVTIPSASTATRLVAVAIRRVLTKSGATDVSPTGRAPPQPGHDLSSRPVSRCLDVLKKRKEKSHSEGYEKMVETTATQDLAPGGDPHVGVPGGGRRVGRRRGPPQRLLQSHPGASRNSRSNPGLGLAAHERRDGRCLAGHINTHE
ncbi:Protein of unknown function [Gryllus bimaculatus]|nr:Protein of unknown function [Gryllus bimaculatus]